MSTNLVPPFNNAYKLLQQNILNQLLAMDPQTFTNSQSEMNTFSSNLYCEVGKLLDFIDTSINASTRIRTQVDSKLNTINQEISIKEGEIARVETQIQGVAANIENKQSQIKIAEESVKQAEIAVGNAETELRQAEKEVEEARLCAGLLGRKKRFLGAFWTPMEYFFVKPMELAMNTAGGMMVNGFVKPVCSVINYQQIDNAKKNVETKKQELVSFRNLVNTYKNDLKPIQNELIAYSTALQQLNNELNELKITLITLPAEQHIIISIDQTLKATESYIRTLFTTSASFIDVIMKMIDFEFVIKPMNAIYEELQQKQFLLALNFGKMTEAQINQAKTKLQSLVLLAFNSPWKTENMRCSK